MTDSKRGTPERSRTYIALLFGFNFMIWASMGILAPIEILFLGTLTDNTAAKGLILGISSVVLLIFSPAATRVSDKFGRKKTMVLFITFSLPFFVLLPQSQTYQMYGIIKVFSSLLFLSTPVLFAYISDSVKRLGIGYGSVILAGSLGGSLGSLMSGAVGEFFGFGTSYMLLALVAFASVIFILPLQEFYGRPEKREKGRIRLDFIVLAVLANTAVFSFHLSARSVLWPLVLQGITNSPAVFSGLIFSLMGLAAASLSIPTGVFAERIGERRVFFLGWIIMGIAGVAIFLTTRDIIMFSILSITFAVGEVLKGPSGSMILAKYKRSVYFGYGSSISSLGGLFGAVAAGMLVSLLGIGDAVLLVGMLVLVSAIPFVLVYILRND